MIALDRGWRVLEFREPAFPARQGHGAVERTPRHPAARRRGRRGLGARRRADATSVSRRARLLRGRRGQARRPLPRRRVAREARARPLAHRLARDAAGPDARPRRLHAEPGYERWDSDGALGYLTLAAIVEAQLGDPPSRARVVVASNCFPTGMLGWYVRRLAEGGLVAALTATSPARLAHPAGGEPLAGTNPLALAIPSSDERPLVADVSMGAVTYGDVLRGAAARTSSCPSAASRRTRRSRSRSGSSSSSARSRATATAPCSSSRGRKPIPCPRSASGRGAYDSPATRRAARSSSSSAHRFKLRVELEGAVELDPRLVEPTRLRVDARAVVEKRRVVGLRGEAGVDLGQGTV